MPRVNRDDPSKRYSILLIHNCTEVDDRGKCISGHKLLDVTPVNNTRNYKYSMINNVSKSNSSSTPKSNSTSTPKSYNKVNNYIIGNKLNVKDFMVEPLEIFTGTYWDAEDRLKIIGETLGLTTKHTLSPTASEYFKSNLNKAKASKEAKASGGESSDSGDDSLDKIEHIVKNPTPPRTFKNEQVKCECGKFVIRMNMARHCKTSFHKQKVKTE